MKLSIRFIPVSFLTPSETSVPGYTESRNVFAPRRIRYLLPKGLDDRATFMHAYIIFLSNEVYEN
jgi:hypothetical protein